MHIKTISLNDLFSRLGSREVFKVVAMWACVGAFCLFLANILVQGA